ncbi:hypothetical protein LGK95_07610 [Clostridium algoriphilum]|uniref:hypothetical protein n=1 Tax=Clostridium algoriphilum TaxID=198347 RepID=UPI001CF5D491|nr:hypothetical protein [Clostridium algoriphilum]MCB2293386.1 hypothetical protein [Clostridium algoriphilum]
MTKFESKVCSFIIAITVLVFVLPTYTVNAQTKTLSDALLKTNMVTSMESTGKLNLTFKADGLSNQDQQDFGLVSEILNNLQVNIDTKRSGNSDGSILRQYAKMSANVGGSPYSGELWSDINLTSNPPVIKEIVKSPQLFEMMMLDPQYVNKYMLLDLQQIKNMPEMQTDLSSMDFGKMISENKELQKSILTLIEKYSSQLSSNYNLITKVGNEYKVKIDDAKFKDIVRSVVNLTAKNKEMQNLISDLTITEMKNSGASTEEINSTKVEMKQMFTTLESQEFLDQFNQTMDKLKDVHILGSKGIDITYIIDENGYVISTKGVIDLHIDMAKLSKVFGESASEVMPTGIYSVGINFEVTNSNINGIVNINLPMLTSANSFNIINLFDDPNSQPIKEITSAIKGGNIPKISKVVIKPAVVKPVVVKHTVTGGQLPKTSSQLYDLLLIGTVITIIGALGLNRRKKHE